MTDGPVAASPQPPAAPAAVPSPKVKTGAGLVGLTAALLSFVDRKLDFYPRLETQVRSVPAEELIKRFYDPTSGVMVPWSALDPNDTNFEKAIDLAKASLEEAKAQTEYQDQKATRLLTVSTFLTALAGAFYATFATDYPLKTLPQQTGWHWWLLTGTYLFFFLFILCSLAGALVTFHATRTRFKYPAEATVKRQSDNTRSYLFFREMIGVTPEAWANSFVTITGPATARTATLNPNLKVEYLKNYVSEAYLIAAKTADKLRYLQPAQSLLSYALRALVIYIVLLAIVVTTLAPTKEAIPPTEIKIIAEPQPVHVRVDQLPTVALRPLPKTGKHP